MCARLISLLILLPCLAWAELCHDGVRQKAFPGAEGFGNCAAGGRGGTVFLVTNTNDSGAGSLRDCLESAGARYCIIRTGGTLTLLSRIQVNNGQVTLVGNTAPADSGGLQIKDHGITFRSSADDIIVRYMKIRMGTDLPDPPDEDPITFIEESGTMDDVILDHSSLQWGIDENINTWNDINNVTIQWNITAEGSLTGHVEGPHSMGFLHGSASTAGDNTEISMHHNLFAHNADRNPFTNRGAFFDFVNNIIYNWDNVGHSKFSNPSSAADAEANIINNYWKKGGDSSGTNWVICVDGAASIWLTGNIGPNCTTACDSWTIGVRNCPDFTEADQGTFEAPGAFSAPAVTTLAAADLFDQVLPTVGASLPVRDSVDARIVDETTNGTGSVGIGSAFPTLAVGTAPLDTDSDGMPDQAEILCGLNPNSSTDATQDADGDGWDNVEEIIYPEGSLRHATLHGAISGQGVRSCDDRLSKVL